MSDKRKALVISVIAFLLIAVPLALTLLMRKPALDEKTLCGPGGGNDRVVVLVDKSDKWGGDDVARVRQLLVSIYQEVPAQGRLRVYGITGEAKKLTEINLFFDMCNPGSEKECNALYENCRRMKTVYARSFEEPLGRLADTLMLPGQSSYSPILEALSEIAHERGTGSLKIHLISDLMENGPRFRFYDVVPLDEEMIEQYPLPKNIQLTVDAHLIERRRHSRDLVNAVVNAWKGYFAKQGVAAEVLPIFVAD